jgi:prepilin-type N-terminal cleavage/methylation domain-containing protein/prepilin-type processing-associated H-X9-DG protein
MRQTHTRRAFTLIEVLVVVAIIALLVAILLPSLASAKRQSKIVVCQTNLHQLGLGIASYANQQRVIPFGPTVDMLFPMLEENKGDLATNQIWTGPQVIQPDNAVKPQAMGLGLLLGRSSMWPQMMYCPDDDSNDPLEELAKVKEKTDKAAYSSYLYRQLQETNGQGKLENLGFNTNKTDKTKKGNRATTLALDMNALLSISPDATRTNHKAAKVNVLYFDGSARTYDNAKHEFSLRDEDLMDLKEGRADILRECDKRY